MMRDVTPIRFSSAAQGKSRLSWCPPCRSRTKAERQGWGTTLGVVAKGWATSHNFMDVCERLGHQATRVTHNLLFDGWTANRLTNELGQIRKPPLRAAL